MKTFFAFIFTILSLLFVSSASAQAPQALYWDPGVSLGASLGGSGNWDTNASDNVTNWFDGANDDLWTNGNYDAYFTGPAGAVTIAAGQQIYAADLIFTNVTGTGYLITNSTGAEVLNVANTIDTETNDDILAVQVGNQGTLTKTGNGRLYLPLDSSATLNGNVMINEGEVTVETNNSLGDNSSAMITVTNNAALEFNGTPNNYLSGGLGFANLTISGSGITNSGALREISGSTAVNANINIAGNVTLDSDSGQMNLNGFEGGAITANGSNYNVTVRGAGSVLVDSTTFNIGTGSIFVLGPGAFYMYVPSADVTRFTNVYVGPGATFEALNDISCGTVPSTLDPTNVILDGGTMAMASAITSSGNRGITVTTNGGVLYNFSGSSTAWTLPGIYATNQPILFTNSSSSYYKATTGVAFLLGMGPLVIGGGSFTMEPTVAPVYSNLVLNGDTFTFNYDNTSGQIDDLGAVPSTYTVSNIWLSGGQFHVGHSTTVQATRGIYVTSAGSAIEDVTGGGTATIAGPISGPGGLTFNGNRVVLEGTNSYGATTVSSGLLFVGGGGSSGTLGTGNTSLSGGGMYFDRTGTYTYGGAISGTYGLTNEASGVVTLTGKCTYTGVTGITAGTLLMNNTNASVTTVYSGGTLGGTGPFGAAITVNSGGTLTLGSGTLSTSNNVTLSGNVNVLLNKSLPQTSGTAIVGGTLTGSGTVNISVTNQGPALAVGDTFTLFNKAIGGSATINITGGGTGVTWVNNGDGTISVATVPAPPKPVIKSMYISNGDFIFSGTNGTAGDTNYVLTTTNLLLPINQWIPISTNIFTGNAFSITNPIIPGSPQLFYILQVP